MQETFADLEDSLQTLVDGGKIEVGGTSEEEEAMCEAAAVYAPDQKVEPFEIAMIEELKDALEIAKKFPSKKEEVLIQLMRIHEMVQSAKLAAVQNYLASIISLFVRTPSIPIRSKTAN